MSSRTLTHKEGQRLRSLHAAIVRGDFDEGVVAELLVLLRYRSRGAIRELAQCVAHAERDGGEFLKRIAANADLMENLGRRSGVIDTREVIPAERFAKDLNHSLLQQTLGPLPRSRCDALLLCGLSRLQGTTVGKAARYGELSIGLSEGRCTLLATVPIVNNGRRVRFQFALSSVPNTWLPICNPRAHVQPTGLVSVRIVDGRAEVEGFPQFNVHFERDPPIRSQELDSLEGVDGWKRMPDGLEFRDGAARMPLRFDGMRLTVAGLPEYFASGSRNEAALRALHGRLGGCVHDDGGAHWFLPGLKVASDGFHSHWVGRGSPTCTRPA